MDMEYLLLQWALHSPAFRHGACQTHQLCRHYADDARLDA